MAVQMDGDADLAGQIVLLTPGLSCFTLFGWIFLLKTLGLF
jgi:predicted permease